jgi:hypothetical protein
MRYDSLMTAEQLAAFIADARAKADAALAQLAAVDPATLPPELRDDYEQERAEWEEVRALTAHDAVTLHLAACEYAGRDLTDDEVRGLLRRQ